MEKAIAKLSFTDFSAEKVDSEEDAASDVDAVETRMMVIKQNRKGKKSGGFQSMGLSHPVFTGVMKKGYRVPTPIQRKCIPLVLDGKDVVGMARTGSGKTAAFLVPLLERLRTHSAKIGARGLILSPTRELATQTMKFTKELGKCTDLRAALILGGDRMEEQFSAMHRNPDILIATPGRFLHLVVEMELQLSSIEYVVFDEADRLFEMGFSEQLTEIIRRLPESRQTLLFSATLPKQLVEFAKAGLRDPVLVRLDVDSKLSNELKLCYLATRPDDKPAVLLYLLRNILNSNEQTVVFTPTKHHVEYLKELLEAAGIPSTYIYSSLDQVARKINVAKFVNRKVMVMIVTDIAARGIDIPMLDNVINYNFPTKPKLFVHRVGRVARAGRSGTAYSLISSDEVPYMLDLHLFLGRPLQLSNSSQTTSKSNGASYQSGVYGSVPQSVIEQEEDVIQKLHSSSSELDALKKVSMNAQKQYIRSRNQPAPESVKRAKDLPQVVQLHPMFEELCSTEELQRSRLMDTLKSFRPAKTIFEVHSIANSDSKQVMRSKREYHSTVVIANREKQRKKVSPETADLDGGHEHISDDDLAVFQTEQSVSLKKKGKKRARTIDKEHYLRYKPSDIHSEKGLSLGNSFDQQAAGAVLDLDGDEEQTMKKISGTLKWDRKRKKFVGDSGQEPKQKRIKTEGGQWIKASYKSDAYQRWQDTHKIEGLLSARDNEDAIQKPATNTKHSRFHTSRVTRTKGSRKKETIGDLKPKEEILKRRHRREVMERKKRKGSMMKGQSSKRQKGGRNKR